MAKSGSGLPLAPHPSTPGEAVRRAVASVEWVNPESLRFEYVLEADEERIRIPPQAAGAARADELWAHTCFEAFIGLPGSLRYLELNFSPSGRWAAYRFDSYRQGRAPALDSTPRLALRRGEGRVELEAVVDSCPILSGSGPLRIALSMVVEDREGRLSYWALRHPPGRPDFHHPESFSLVLELPRNPLNSP